MKASAAPIPSWKIFRLCARAIPVAFRRIPASFYRLVHHVIEIGSKKKMRNGAARCVIAVVTDEKLAGVYSCRKEIGDAVRPKGLPD